MVPTLILQPEGQNDTGYTIGMEDVAKLVAMADSEPDLEVLGFTVNMGLTDETQCAIEVPPGEPARNFIAAVRWFHAALTLAGPMPAT